MANLYDHNQGFEKGKESPRAFRAFNIYLELGRDRSVRRTAELDGTSYDNIKKWADKYAWRSRAAAWDRDRVKETFADVRAERAAEHKAKIHKFRETQERRAEDMGDLADLMLSLTVEKLEAMRAAGELPSEQSISNLAKTVASLADMAMNMQATALGVEDLCDQLETELAE